MVIIVIVWILLNSVPEVCILEMAELLFHDKKEDSPRDDTVGLAAAVTMCAQGPGLLSRPGSAGHSSCNRLLCHFIMECHSYFVCIHGVYMVNNKYTSIYYCLSLRKQLPFQGCFTALPSQVKQALSIQVLSIYSKSF